MQATQSMTQGIVNPVLADQLLSLSDISRLHRGMSASAKPAAPRPRAKPPVVVLDEVVVADLTDARPSISMRLKHALAGFGVNLLGGATTVVSTLNTTLNPIARESQAAVAGISPLITEDYADVIFDPEFFSDLVAEYHERKTLPVKAIVDTKDQTSLFEQQVTMALAQVTRMAEALQAENRRHDTPNGDVTDYLMHAGYEDGGERTLEIVAALLMTHRNSFDKRLTQLGYPVTMVPGESVKLFLTHKQWVVIVL